jgi:hypothetical protein
MARQLLAIGSALGALLFLAGAASAAPALGACVLSETEARALNARRVPAELALRIEANESGVGAAPRITTGAAVPAGAAVVVAVMLDGEATIAIPQGWRSVSSRSSEGMITTTLTDPPAASGSSQYVVAYKVTEAAGAVTFNATLSEHKPWTVGIVACR